MSANSASRGGMLAAAILIVVLCSAVGIAGGWGFDGVAGIAGSGSGVSEFGKSRRSSDAKDQVTAMIGKLTGANSCAASSCHGGGRVGEDLSFAASQIWQRRDVHARAWQVLTQPLASEMMRRLADPGSPPIPAKEDARCLNCHVTTEVPYSAPRISEAVHHRDGVSCESCHGAGEWMAGCTYHICVARFFSGAKGRAWFHRHDSEPAGESKDLCRVSRWGCRKRRES
jgi:hypothetical protein